MDNLSLDHSIYSGVVLNVLWALTGIEISFRYDDNDTISNLYVEVRKIKRFMDEVDEKLAPLIPMSLYGDFGKLSNIVIPFGEIGTRIDPLFSHLQLYPSSPPRGV
jgi:hypothetical protein